MERYQKKLKTRILVKAAAAVLLAGILLVFLYAPIYGNETADGARLGLGRLPLVAPYVLGAAYGLFIAYEGILLYGIVSDWLALKSPERRKKRYICETDERKQLINQRTGVQAFQIIAAGLELGILVAGFLNETVFFTLVGALTFVALAKASLKTYYTRKYGA